MRPQFIDTLDIEEVIDDNYRGREGMMVGVRMEKLFNIRERNLYHVLTVLD